MKKDNVLIHRLRNTFTLAIAAPLLAIVMMSSSGCDQEESDASASPDAELDVGFRSGTSPTGGGAATFWNTSTTRGPVVDFDRDYFKATCDTTEGILGVSISPSSGQPHTALCDDFSFSGTTTAVLFAGSDQRLDHRVYNTSTDWDPNNYKTECGAHGYISGLSQDTSTHVLHGVRCSESAGLDTTNNCEVKVIYGTNAWSNDYGDWDYGFDKGDCPDGKIAVGVSEVPSTGKIHALLCCNVDY